jgi:hypothetical protein
MKKMRIPDSLSKAFLCFIMTSFWKIYLILTKKR